MRADPRAVWTGGAVYVLPRTTFEPSDVAAEWISFAPVVPLGAVPVARGDFPFARRVFRFEHPESDWRRLGRLVANGVADAFSR